MSKDNHRMIQEERSGSWLIRVFRRKARGKKTPRILCKCGCCDERVEIYYNNDSLEINGVNGSIQNWREVLLPLLNTKKRD